MVSDPSLKRIFGDTLPFLVAVLVRLEGGDSEHPPARTFDLTGSRGEQDWLRLALDCERALLDTFDLPLWRTDPEAMRERERGQFMPSPAMQAFAACGGAFSPGPLPASHGHGLPHVDHLAEEIDTMVDAARRGETRHFLFRVADGERGSGQVWPDVYGLAEEIGRRTDPTHVHCMRVKPDGGFGERPGFSAFASALICDPTAIRVMPGIDPILGGAPDLTGWAADGSYKLPRTAAGLDTVEAIERGDRMIRQLTGVHVWCCPASTKAEDAVWVPHTGRAVLPPLEKNDGRRAVYDPVFMPHCRSSRRTSDGPRARAKNTGGISNASAKSSSEGRSDRAH